MAVALIIFEGLAIVIVGNFLWIKAVQSIVPGFQEQRGRIWFLGPFLTRQEQFTAEGWRWCRLEWRVPWAAWSSSCSPLYSSLASRRLTSA